MPAFESTLRAQYQRDLDLFQFPRQVVKKVKVSDPSELLPKLPDPLELLPFPQVLRDEFFGHSAAVTSVAIEPTNGQYIATGLLLTHLYHQFTNFHYFYHLLIHICNSATVLVPNHSNRIQRWDCACVGCHHSAVHSFSLLPVSNLLSCLATSTTLIFLISSSALFHTHHLSCCIRRVCSSLFAFPLAKLSLSGIPIPPLR